MVHFPKLISVVFLHYPKVLKRSIQVPCDLTEESIIFIVTNSHEREGPQTITCLLDGKLFSNIFVQFAHMLETKEAGLKV